MVVELIVSPPPDEQVAVTRLFPLSRTRLFAQVPAESPLKIGVPEKVRLPESVGVPENVPAREPPPERAAVPEYVLFPERVRFPLSKPNLPPEVPARPEVLRRKVSSWVMVA
jgi:hypothetical protein